MQEILTLMHANIKYADQPGHQSSPRLEITENFLLFTTFRNHKPNEIAKFHQISVRNFPTPHAHFDNINGSVHVISNNVAF